MLAADCIRATGTWQRTSSRSCRQAAAALLGAQRTCRGTPSERTAGAILRTALGCDYAPRAITFGEGALIAQVPNDPLDRLAESRLPVAPNESIEGVLRKVAVGHVVTTWGCGADPSVPPLAGAPATDALGRWPLRPGLAPTGAFRPFDLLRDFSGVIYLQRVLAEDMPTDRAAVPPRKK